MFCSDLFLINSGVLSSCPAFARFFLSHPLFLFFLSQYQYLCCIVRSRMHHRALISIDWSVGLYTSQLIDANSLL